MVWGAASNLSQVKEARHLERPDNLTPANPHQESGADGSTLLGESRSERRSLEKALHPRNEVGS